MNVIYTSRIGSYLKIFTVCLLVGLTFAPGKSSAQCPGTVTATAATKLGCSFFTANWGTPTGTITDYYLDVSPAFDFSISLPGYPMAIGSTATSYAVTGLSPSTTYFYRIKGIDGITCMSTSWSNIEVLTTQANSVTCQCTPVNDLVCATDYISNVTVNTLNNNSGCSTGGYSLYSAAGDTTVLAIDSTYTLSITTAGSNPGIFGAGAWFDFNHNTSLADAGEFFNISNIITTGSTISQHVTIPLTATPGFTTMRIRMGLNAVDATDACTMPNNTDGETEDYTVCLYNSINIPNPPRNTLSCVGNIPVLFVGATGSVASYQWYSNTTNAIVGGTLIPGATNASYSPDASVYNTPGVYYYYCVLGSICGTGGTTTPSPNAASLTVSAVPTVSGIITPVTLLCKGNPLTLVANNSVGTGLPTYEWSGPNGYTATTSPIDTAVFNPTSTAASGNYSLTVVYPGAGCISNQVVSSAITVNDSPKVTAIIPSPSQLCTSGTLTLTATGATGSGSLISYTWGGPNGYASTTVSNIAIFSPTVTADSGAYTVFVTYPGEGCISATDTSIRVKVDTAAAAITGNAYICYQGTTTFHNTTPVGTGTGWSSSNPAVGTIDPASGVVTTTGPGNTDITYSVTNSCGTTTSTITLTVNPLPAIITANVPVCVGLTVCLTDGSSGGAWSSASGHVSVVSSTGCITGSSAGTALITYQLPTSCLVTAIVTVNPNPTPILGNKNVCFNLTTSLTDATAGGTWSSNNGNITFPGTTGTALGAAVGTATVVYTLPTGCINTATVTVNPLPQPILGTNVVCVSLQTSLSDQTAGGTWSSSTTSQATINTAGTVTGVAQGVPTITYTLPTGCIATTPLTVNPLSAILGVPKVCYQQSVTISDTTVGGTWSSDNSNAIIGSTTGTIYGNAVGTSHITYTLPTGCAAYTVATVNPLPLVINGNAPVCSGRTVCLTDGTGGGAWTSGDISIATVIGTSGCVTGASIAATNTVTVTYTLATGCNMTTIITVNPLPTNILGTPSVCNGLTNCLSDATAGGTWASNNTGVATVSSTGCVTGVSIVLPTTLISYTLPTGCFTTTSFTVNPLPGTISGPHSVCSGSQITLSDAGGGTWTSGDNSIATIGSSSGTVTGIATTTATVAIVYTLPTGCTISTVITVNPLPAAITPAPDSVCANSQITLSDATGTGVWSTTSLFASVGSSSGTVTGISQGTGFITYTIPTGCYVTQVVTVNPLPQIITGNPNLCLNQTTNLSDASSDGLWSSSDPSIASIGSATGAVTANIINTTTITYTLPTGCYITTPVTVNALPSNITFATVGQVCPGLSITLSDGSSGGTWSSNNTPVATVASTGVVTGVATAGGVATISYTLGTGCSVSANVTVNQAPATISGSPNICFGSTSSLSDTPLGGTWTSVNTGVVTIGSSSGTINTVSAGTSTISYTLPVTGCAASLTVTVVSAVAAITGTTSVCSGQSVQLSDATIGGSWSNSAGPATVDASTGIVTGTGASGTATITYTLGTTGCVATTAFTVNPIPATITGTMNVCSGGTTTLSDITPGIVWSSSNSSIAAIGTSGIVTGGSVGASTTVTINATAAGCFNSTTVTVNPLPAAISGAGTVCSGASLTLSDISAGGTWSSGNTGLAIVGGTTGVVTGQGVSAGSAGIIYTLPTGCSTTASVNVIVSIPGISGVATNCPQFPISLSDATTGGTWSSSNVAITIGSTGSVTASAAGTSNITYTIGGICSVTKTVTFNNVPAINGATSLCLGASTVFSDASGGGTWSSTNPTAVSIGSSSGNVTTGATGSATITYTLSGGCNTTTTVTVASSVPGILGVASVCKLANTSLSDALSGGTWASNNTSIAGVSSTGTVTGVNAGSTTITYTLVGGCFATKNVTVNGLPGTIQGTLSMCQNGSTVLSDATTGGTFTSSSLTITPTITTATVTATSSGTFSVTYTTVGGCAISTNVTVNPSPSPISGPSGVCFLSAVLESDPTPLGTWSSSNTAVVFEFSGETFGVGVGTANITYQLTATGCSVSKAITVNPLPASISGINTVCAGLTTSLSDPSGSGTWSSTDATVANINLTSGLATGVGAGTATITFTLPTGCSADTTITVLQSPTPILGAQGTCYGTISTLSDTTTGGTWSSNNTLVASVGGVSGVVSGLGLGSATISYTLSDGCSQTINFNVTAFPNAITGSSSVCAGAATTLSSTTTGGSWSSSNTSIATINGTTGVVTGVAGGLVTITYTTPAGCSVTTTLNVLNAVGPITGPSNSVCLGLSITLSDTTAGGTWSSNNTTNATIGSSSGVVNGLTLGSAIITYTAPSACYSTTTVNVVNAVPSISGASFNVCPGFNITLSDASTGGTWSSTSANATIGSSSGIVTGVTPGTATISYSLNAGCFVATTVTVNGQPINGNTNICTGASVTLSDVESGGTWSSLNINVSVNASAGTVSGITTGTAVISYLTPTGCTVTTTVTVINALSAITGTPPVCVGLTTSLSDLTTGGTWTSGSTGVAIIGSSDGMVTGMSAGTANITYTLGSGCNTTTTITVNPLSNILGTASVCSGLTTSLSDATLGGTWSGTNAFANVGSSGIVTGLSAGTATVTYTLPTGCAATAVVTVYPLALITGTTSVCAGSFTCLTDAVSGGTWSSSNGNVVIGSTTCLIEGAIAGTAIITYSLPHGCSASVVVTVNPITNILGTARVCAGLTTSLSDATGTGTWTSDNADATVGSSSGMVTGVSAGTANITYMLGTGCSATVVVTVNPLANISGITSVCVGSATSLSDAATGGTWFSDNTAVAGIGSDGTVSGVHAGTANITYTLSTGCTATTEVTVNPISPVLGTTSVCAGLTTSLSDATTGGTWTSDNADATIGSSSGMVTGISAGTANITYSLSTGCSATAVVTVNPLAPVTGLNNVCATGTTTLSDAVTGGTWTSGNLATGTIDASSGLFAGLTPGTTVITYSLSTGCSVTDTVTVISSLPLITGNTVDCIGVISILSDAVTGGTWTSSATSIATVDPLSGAVDGLIAGSATITYSIGSTCKTTILVSVNSLPADISGTFQVCAGLTTTLTDGTAGGNWTSGSTGIATVGSGSGTVAGVSAGTANITYTTPAGCIATAPITVNPLPAVISGVANICIASSTSLSDSTIGGTWTSSNLSVGTIDPESGMVTTFVAGTSSITYTLPTGCLDSTTLTVVNIVSPILGNRFVCTGYTTALSDALAGGAWTNDNADATVDPVSGIVSGVSAGTTSVTYTLGLGCFATASVTINASPSAISGTMYVCAGSSVTLTDGSGGGTWSTNNTGISVGSLSGSVTGINSGVDTVTYAVASGCSTSTTFTVNALPVQYHVGGSGSYCLGSPGVHVTLSGSDTGISYLVYQGSFATGIDSAGTGAAIDFGALTIGSYTVLATNNITSCSAGMLDSAVISITALVVPSISISTISGDTVCAGTYYTFSATATNGGTAPVYEWQVNGVSPGADSSHYSYIPSNGDVVTVKLTSNAVCAAPDTAMDTVVMTVNENKIPGVSISILPGDTLCAGTLAVFSAVDTFGGVTPAFTWIKNGTVVGTGSTYMFTPYIPDNSDVIYCKMASNYACITADTVISDYIRLTVDSSLIPVITLTASPGAVILKGQSDTITATVVNAGSSPSYQWLVNTTIIPGATTNVFISDTLSNGDSVTCIVHGSGECGLYTFNSAVIITDGILNVKQITSGNSDIRLLPNPNNGSFMLRGTLGTTQDEEVSVEITDMVGQVIYKTKILAVNGKINEQIRLNNALPNGMYSLNLHSQTENKVFHMVIEQ